MAVASALSQLQSNLYRRHSSGARYSVRNEKGKSSGRYRKRFSYFPTAREAIARIGVIVRAAKPEIMPDKSLGLRTRNPIQASQVLGRETFISIFNVLFLDSPQEKSGIIPGEISSLLSRSV